jgi:hypothetical protein
MRTLLKAILVAVIGSQLALGAISINASSQRQIVTPLATRATQPTVIEAGSTTRANTPPAKEEYTGTVVGVGGTMGGVSRPFTLTIEDRTSASEAGRAIATLAEGGQDALLKDLQSKKLGRFSLGGQIGHDLNFVNETPTAKGGRRITILFERWMNLFELRSGARSQDYPFTYIELVLDASGKGEGQFIAAAKIYFDKKHDNELNVENFGVYPARLVGVELRNTERPN